MKQAAPQDANQASTAPIAITEEKLKYHADAE